MDLDFSDYKKVFRPETILDIVPQDLLQSMLEGFFYGEKAGVMLVYDRFNPNTISQNGRDLYILDPFPGALPRSITRELKLLKEGKISTQLNIKNNNPFCVTYRQDSLHNEEQCLMSDYERALKAFVSKVTDDLDRCP